jgi:hypothetical protein
VPKKVIIAVLFAFSQMITLASGALAGGDTTYVVNTTNACINGTYKLYSPNVTAPTLVLIDRRVNFDPTPPLSLGGCTTAASNNAGCGRDAGPPFMQLSATASLPAAGPFCSWNCGACGMIVTDDGDGLPVELMGFGFEEEAAGEDDVKNGGGGGEDR